MIVANSDIEFCYLCTAQCLSLGLNPVLTQTINSSSVRVNGLGNSHKEPNSSQSKPKSGIKKWPKDLFASISLISISYKGEK